MARSRGCAGGCRASSRLSPPTCCRWTSRTTGGCATSSTKPSAAAPCSAWSRISRRPPSSLRQICLPRADRPKFSALAGRFSRLTGALGFLLTIPNAIALRRYLEGHLETVRRRGGEGLIAEIVRVEKEGGRISPNEIVSMVFLLLFAGHETTTHLISGSVHELLKNPGLRDWLEQDWSRADLAVEEFLRFLTPVQFTKPRYV